MHILYILIGLTIILVGSSIMFVVWYYLGYNFNKYVLNEDRFLYVNRTRYNIFTGFVVNDLIILLVYIADMLGSYIYHG